MGVPKVRRTLFSLATQRSQQTVSSFSRLPHTLAEQATPYSTGPGSIDATIVNRFKLLFKKRARSLRSVEVKGGR